MCPHTLLLANVQKKAFTFMSECHGTYMSLDSSRATQWLILMRNLTVQITIQG